MYYRERDFIPAIFAPDLETAFFCYALLSFTGRGLGICLECGEVFQRTREDILYCCQSHASAYRLRRWREKQREARKKRKK